MKVVAGVDWSEESFAAVEQLALLYRPDEVAIVHGVDLGLFQSPMVAQAANLQGYDEFRQAMIDAGRQVVERGRSLLPAGIPAVKTLCDVQPAASFILDTANTLKADLIVVGTHNRSRVTEMLMGSVSHQVLLHAVTATLIVKGPARPVTRVLMAVEGREDAVHLQSWLSAHPFKEPVSVSILSVVPALQMIEPHVAVGLEKWSQENVEYARQIVQNTARSLAGPHYKTCEEVRTGDPITTVCDLGGQHDLIVVGSHGRTGLGRFLLGSVSHGIVHRAPVSVLVVR